MNFLKNLSSLMRTVLMLLLMLAMAAAALWYWQSHRYQRSTEDAYVNANIVQVSSLVMGPVTELRVHDNQFVKRGEVLFEVDRRPFELALAVAEAKLGQTQMGARQDFSELRAAEADVAKQNADHVNAESNLARTRSLIAKNFLSKQAEDDVLARVSSSSASLAQAQAKAEKARTALSVNGQLTPETRLALSDISRARLNLDYSTVRAAEDAWVNNFNLAKGTVVTPGIPLFALIVDNSFWVDANFKETELHDIHVGQLANIALDIYPDHIFNGMVESIGGGTGSAFSLLPAQNASGNWVKVTQRVPVRIRLLESDAAFPLRVGISATVTVKLK